uniref:Uncharacterized protein n=1 Tax=viral metagenome TaxID=1070528 RepID=A0A6M3KRW1_9ZZZZ
MNGYWRLYAKIFNIKICRTCGRRLDLNYKKRNRNNLCKDCSPLGIDFVTVYYNWEL